MPSELLTCVRKSPKIMTINQTEFVVLKKISFVGVSAAAIALAVLCPSPAQALTFNWTFTDQNTGDPVSGTIDTPGSANGLYSTGVTATVTQVPLSWGSSLSYGTFNYYAASGINILNGAIDQSGSDAIVLDNGSGVSLQFADQGSGAFKAVLSDNNAGNGNGLQALSSSNVASFTAVPAPLPLLGLGAATAFSRKLKQRIALRRKREEVIEAA